MMDEQENFGISDEYLVMSDSESRNRRRIDAEERRRLKQTRANAKRGFTRALNRVAETMLAESPLSEVITSEINLKTAFDEFCRACELYRDSLVEEDDLDESRAYFHEAEVRFLAMKDRIALRFEQIQQPGQADREHDITPDDSAPKENTIMTLRQSQNFVWSVSDMIGQGATGHVFLCRHKKSGKPFAAKVFNQMGQMRAKQIRIREIELLRKLSHENIVTLEEEEFETCTRSTVLIMELCDTSLYNILELPENYYGLSEIEFRCVLLDVARGMKYLREHNVVHRDVKPGNILKIRSPVGSSVYKLTDFGAAKQLQDADQSFMSIYGTEEYLHPDVYEKAVMKNFTRKTFTAAVDQWSMGVTFYHAATGQLPFRPYGGRQNKETMYEIISKKGPRIISGIQKVNAGRIEYDDDLPEETRISKGLKLLLRPILQELLETNEEENVITFDQFYQRVEDIASRKVFEVFSTNSSAWHKVYLKQDENIATLRSLVEFQTGIEIENQRLFLSLKEFTPDVTICVKDYPKVTRQDPLIVIGGEPVQNEHLYQRRILKLPRMPAGKTRPDNDLELFKIYASVCFVYKFCAEDLFGSCNATKLALVTLSLVITSKADQCKQLYRQQEKQKKLIDQMLFRANRELNYLKEMSMHFSDGDPASSVVQGSEGRLQNGEIDLSQRLQQMQDLFEKTKAILAGHQLAVPLGSQSVDEIEKSLAVIKTLVDDVNNIYLNIAKDKHIGNSNLEDLIHIAKKQQVGDCLAAIKDKFSSVASVRSNFHTLFHDWFRNVGMKFQELTYVLTALENLDLDLLEQVAIHEFDEIETEKRSVLEAIDSEECSLKTESASQSSIPCLSSIAAEVTSLETVLQDIMTLVEEGDQKLLSTKEIFDELSTCGS